MDDKKQKQDQVQDRNFHMEIGTEFGIDTNLKNRAASILEDKFVRGFIAGAASAIFALSIAALVLYML